MLYRKTELKCIYVCVAYIHVHVCTPRTDACIDAHVCLCTCSQAQVPEFFIRWYFHMEFYVMVSACFTYVHYVFVAAKIHSWKNQQEQRLESHMFIPDLALLTMWNKESTDYNLQMNLFHHVCWYWNIEVLTETRWLQHNCTVFGRYWEMIIQRKGIPQKCHFQWHNSNEILWHLCKGYCFIPKMLSVA